MQGHFSALLLKACDSAYMYIVTYIHIYILTCIDPSEIPYRQISLEVSGTSKKQCLTHDTLIGVIVTQTNNTLQLN